MSSSPRQVSAESSWRNLPAWVLDRFPPAVAVMFGVMFAGLAGVSRLAVADPAERSIGEWALAYLAFLGLFLAMRVLDEHKDFAEDRVNHPDRPLSQGLITLGQLRIVGAGGVLVGLVASVSLDGDRRAQLLMMAVAYGFVLLTAVEFFARSWLRQRIVLYGLTHGVVTPLAAWWAMTLAAGSVPVEAPAPAILALALWSSYAFELARKITLPAHFAEIPNSYSEAVGVTSSARLLFGCCALSALSVIWVFVGADAVADTLSSGRGLVAAVMAAIALGCWALIDMAFIGRAFEDTLKLVEPGVGLGLLITWLAVALATL